MTSFRFLMRQLFHNSVVLGTLMICAAVVALLAWTIGKLVVDYGVSLAYLAWPLTVVLISIGLMYGVVRVMIFHPEFDAAYSEWLATTPWTPEHPLPKGPLHVVVPDILIVAVLTVLAWPVSLALPSDRLFFVLGPMMGFAAGLASMWTLANWVCGERTSVYLAIAVLVLAKPLSVPIVLLPLVPVVAAAVAWRGVRQSLYRFPWHGASQAQQRAREKRAQAAIGWPYGQLMQSPPEFITTWWRAAVEAALVGGAVWTFVSLVPPKDPQEDLKGLRMVIAIGTFIGVSFRLIQYAPAICDHFCLGRRLANRRWILSTHDQIFLPPLAMLVIGWTFPWLLAEFANLSIPVAAALTVSTVWYIGRGVGPRIGSLVLTGIHSKFGQRPPSKDFARIDGP